MLAGKRARLVEQLAEIQDSIDFIDAKQRFYDDVLSGATPYVSVLIPSAALAKESEEPGELKGWRGNRFDRAVSSSGIQARTTVCCTALGERDMPLDWNQQAHSETRESFSDVGR